MANYSILISGQVAANQTDAYVKSGKCGAVEAKTDLGETAVIHMADGRPRSEWWYDA